MLKDGFTQEFCQDFRENICKNLPQIKSEKICRDKLRAGEVTEVRARNLLEDTYIFVVAGNVTYIIYIYIDMLLTSLLLRGMFLIWRIRRARHSFFGLYLQNHAID